MKKIITILATLLYCSTLLASPNPTAFNESTGVLTGTGFGNVTTAAPAFYDDFESGSIDTSTKWDNPYSMTVTSNRQRGDSDYCAVGDMADSFAGGSMEIKDETLFDGYGGHTYVSVDYQIGDDWDWNDTVWDNGFKFLRIADTSFNDAEFTWSDVGGGGKLTPNNANPAYTINLSYTPKDTMAVNSWYHFEFVIEHPSTNHNSTDATVRLLVTGADKGGLDGTEGLTWWGADTGDTIDHPRVYRLWHSNFGTPSNNSNLYFDNFVADNKLNRVVMTDNETYSSSTKFQYQKMTAHSSTSITITYDKGGVFSNGEKAYMHVWDESDDHGVYEFTIGGDSSTEELQLTGQLSFSNITLQ